MCLNHPETILPSWSMEKLSSTKPVPRAKQFGDQCFKAPPGGHFWAHC